ncbi:MAG: DUF1624 domain-containing protein [Saprospiraceae bacterium]|nr:DUF1624 domain-containing protein [Saprospiraceae bacterium]
MSTAISKSRIESIDLLRGIVMIIMALDHTRDLFHASANIDDPLNPATTTPLLFFTRWITHFCAPVFVFLSGTSIYLQSLRKSKKELNSFLIKRGFWLIIVELTLVTLGITFNPFFNVFVLQVIWTIGISMMILGLLIHLPYKVILALGLIIVLGHNLLDIPESAAGFKAGFLWDLLHHGFFAFYPMTENHGLLLIYPFVAWTGLMILGYCMGIFFTQRYTIEQRKKTLLLFGAGLILLFVVLRGFNLYGDPNPWTPQENGLQSFYSFLRVNKYPPSLLFMCITIGPALLFLVFSEKIKNAFTNILSMYGRTALFYYIVHWYVLHLICGIAFFSRGHSIQDAVDAFHDIPLMFVIPGEGYGLGIVYLVWAIVIIALYPLCKKYDAYKTSHPEKWWLSYL